MGGRGNSYTNKQGKSLFANQVPIKSNTRDDYPARANTRIKDKSVNGAIKDFSKNHKSAPKEHLYSVDNNGYVYEYNHGGKSSVGSDGRGKIGKNNKLTLIHNHPSGGNFSKQDLQIWANSKKYNGIVAVTGKNDFYVKKGNKFNASGFLDGMKKAKASSSDYSKSVDNFLRKNQKNMAILIVSQK